MADRRRYLVMLFDEEDGNAGRLSAIDAERLPERLPPAALSPAAFIMPYEVMTPPLATLSAAGFSIAGNVRLVR